jgi:hypothetical protein
MDKAIELYKKYTPIKIILAQTGLTKPTFYRLLEREGITRTTSESAHHKVLSESHKQNIGKSLKGKFIGIDRYWSTYDLKKGHYKITNDLAYIIGVMFGDGYIVTNQGIGLETIDGDFIKEFNKAVFNQFGLRGRLYKTKPRQLKDWRNGKIYTTKPTTILRIGSIILHDYIIKVKSLNFPNKLTKIQKISFLRGLWDSEGSVWTSGHTCGVQFTHNCLELCQLYQKLLEETTGITSKIGIHAKQGNYYVYFYVRDYIRTFYDIIQPTIQRKRKIFESIINA